MNIQDLIDNTIVPNLHQPLWESWYIKEKIGSGTFSSVYRINAIRADGIDEAALKVQAVTVDNAFALSQERFEGVLESKRQAVANEASIMKKLRDCPNIVRYEEEYTDEIIVDGQRKGYVFLIRMELLNQLSELVRRKAFHCNEQNVIKLAIDLCYGLKAAHDIEIIHRDIKPDNIYISNSGIGKIGDFNLSKTGQSSSTIAGAELYMAPEVYLCKLNSEEKYTKQADIYSLGICLYQLMNDGLLPFEDHMSLEEAVDNRMHGAEFTSPQNASDVFASIIMKACSYNIQNRYKTTDELLDALLKHAHYSSRTSTPTVYASDEESQQIAQNRKSRATVYADSPQSDTVTITSLKQNWLMILMFTILFVVLFILGIVIYLLSAKKNNSAELESSSSISKLDIKNDNIESSTSYLQTAITITNNYNESLIDTDGITNNEVTTNTLSTTIEIQESITTPASIAPSANNLNYCAKIGIVNTKKSDLMLRRLPDANDKTNVIKKIPKGAEITILVPFRSSLDYDRVYWYYAEYEGKNGFVSADYIQLTNNTVPLSDSQITSIAKLLYFIAMRAESWSYSYCFDYDSSKMIECPPDYPDYTQFYYYPISGIYTRQEWFAEIHKQFSAKYDSVRNYNQGLNSLLLSENLYPPYYLCIDNQWCLSDVIFRKGDLPLDLTATAIFKVINLQKTNETENEFHFNGYLDYDAADPDNYYSFGQKQINDFSICFEDGSWKIGYYQSAG